MLKAISVLSILFATSVSASDLIQKPVTCLTPTEGQEIIQEFYSFGLQPLLGFIGYSQTMWGQKYPSSFYLMHNPGPPQQTVIIEKLPSGNICIITGNTGNSVEFDVPTLNKLLTGKETESL